MKIVRVACPHDCPDTCAMLVTVQDGVATKIQGDTSMPFTDGTLCTKVAHYLERTYSPDRLMHPLKRVGKKGKGEFSRIGWDEALARRFPHLDMHPEDASRRADLGGGATFYDCLVEVEKVA